MSWMWALLWLDLLLCVQSFKEQLVSPTVPDSFTLADAPVYNIPLGNFPGVTYPVSKWSVRQWIFITFADDSTGMFGTTTVHDLTAKYFGVYWLSGGDLYAEMGQRFNTITAAQAFPMSKWFFVGVGLTAAYDTFVLTRVRGSNSLSTTLPTTGSWLTTTGQYQGCQFTGKISVRCYTGLLYGRRRASQRRQRKYI